MPKTKTITINGKEYKVTVEKTGEGYIGKVICDNKILVTMNLTEEVASDVELCRGENVPALIFDTLENYLNKVLNSTSV